MELEIIHEEIKQNSFGDLEIGGFFTYYGSLYVKINNSERDNNSIMISNGLPAKMSHYWVVRLPYKATFLF